ncbi:hypothetical protein Peur_015049 [Populus x canadensis]
MNKHGPEHPTQLQIITERFNSSHNLLLLVENFINRRFLFLMAYSKYGYMIAPGWSSLRPSLRRLPISCTASDCRSSSTGPGLLLQLSSASKCCIPIVGLKPWA